MPVLSKSTAPVVNALPMGSDASGPLDDYTVNFVSVGQTNSLAELLKGLPDDQCQCHHWGVVTAGRITFDYGDHSDVVTAGEAFYITPGHVPTAEAGTEFIQFSPTAELVIS